jgi:hypothetical protein
LVAVPIAGTDEVAVSVVAGPGIGRCGKIVLQCEAVGVHRLLVLAERDDLVAADRNGGLRVEHLKVVGARLQRQPLSARQHGRDGRAEVTADLSGKDEAAIPTGCRKVDCLGVGERELVPVDRVVNDARAGNREGAQTAESALVDEAELLVGALGEVGARPGAEVDRLGLEIGVGIIELASIREQAHLGAGGGISYFDEICARTKRHH